MQLYLLDGACLRQLREQAGLSPEELAGMVGRNRGWVEDLEQQSRIHVLEILAYKLTEALQVEISALSTYPSPPEPPTSPEAQRLDMVKLKTLREEASISQEELDEVARLDPGSVAQAEESDGVEEVYAPVETIWRLANRLEVSPTNLLKR